MFNVKKIIYSDVGEVEFRIYDKPIKTGQKRLDKLYEDEDAGEAEVSQENRRRAWRRAKQEIYKLARANRFEWFATFTFSPEKVKRDDYMDCYKKLKNQIDNHLRRKNPEFEYVLVPELHEDGKSYHFHGLIRGIDEKQLEIAINSKTGKPLKHKYQGKWKQVYNWKEYRIGFSTVIRLTDGTSSRAANYMVTQYMTEAIALLTKGKNKYLFSRGLKKPEEQTAYLIKEQIEELKKEIKKRTVHEKTVEIKTLEYENSITYFQVKLHQNDIKKM